MLKLYLRNRNNNKKDKNGKDKKPNWEYRIIGKMINGERPYYSQSGFKTKGAAEEAGNKLLIELQTGGLPVRSSDMMLSTYLDEWIANYVVVNLRHKTELCYRGIVENHLKPNLGNYTLNTLTPKLLQEFANSLKDKNYSKRHIENIVSTLNNALNYAVKQHYIKVNYASFITIPKIEREPRKREIISKSDFERIISRFPFGNKYHIPLIIGYHTGMRISEVHGLTWDNIDLEKGIIRVERQTIRYVNKRWCLGPVKSKAGVRSIKIGSTLLEILKRENIRQKQNRLLYGEFYAKYDLKQVEERKELFELIPSDKEKVNLVCVNEDGKINTTDSFKYCSRVIHHELQIKDFDFHSLRHTHTSLLAATGINPKSLQNRMGHEKIETTLQVYSHELDELFNETGELFERALNGQK